MEMKKIFNIPNILSMLRIVLIPIFVVLYSKADAQNTQYYFYASLALILSGVSDLLDGVIARKFNQITYLGKILDPLADKLTQVVVVICVAIKLDSWVLTAALMVFVIKEILMLVGGLIILRKRITLQSSKWYGKVATAVFYVVMAAIAMFDWISTEMAFLMILVAALFMMFAFSQYIMDFVNIMKKNKKQKTEESVNNL